MGFLLSRGLDIAARDSDGESALHKSAKGGQKEVIRVFLNSVGNQPQPYMLGT